MQPNHTTNTYSYHNKPPGNLVPNQIFCSFFGVSDLQNVQHMLNGMALCVEQTYLDSSKQFIKCRAERGMLWITVTPQSAVLNMSSPVLRWVTVSTHSCMQTKMKALKNLWRAHQRVGPVRLRIFRHIWTVLLPCLLSKFRISM